MQVQPHGACLLLVPSAQTVGTQSGTHIITAWNPAEKELGLSSMRGRESATEKGSQKKGTNPL